MALSSSGQVYSWGYGGRSGLLSYLPFASAVSSVGLSELGDVSRPRVLESIPEKISRIAAGKDLSLALGESGKVYGWGAGLSHINEQVSSTPIVLE